MSVRNKIANFCIHNQRTGCVGGYNPLLLSQPLSLLESEMLSCSECKGILREPHHVDNGYRCKECLLEGEKGKLDETKSKIIKNLSVRCPFREDGCDWEGVIKGFMEHSRECKIVGVSCPYSSYGCDVVRRRKDMELHEEQFLLAHLKMIKNRIDKIEKEVNVTGGIEWEIRGIRELVETGGVKWSSCFYVGLYKFQISFRFDYENDPNTAGALIYLCGGDFDDGLEWPFNGKFTIAVVNRNDLDNSITYRFSTECENVEAFMKPFGTEKNNGFGCLDLANYEDLLLKSCSEDDSIVLKVFIEHTPKWKTVL